MLKCPKTFVHDCTSRLLKQTWRPVKEENVLHTFNLRSRYGIIVEMFYTLYLVWVPFE